MKNHFYAYELAYPESMGGKVFYVGKGFGRRINHHEAEARSGRKSKKCAAIREIWAHGEKVIKRKVVSDVSEQEAFDTECSLIEKHGRENLTNRVSGGNGFARTDQNGCTITLYITNQEWDLLKAKLIAQGQEGTDRQVVLFAKQWAKAGVRMPMAAELEASLQKKIEKLKSGV